MTMSARSAPESAAMTGQPIPGGLPPEAVGDVIEGAQPRHLLDQRTSLPEFSWPREVA